MLLRQMRGLMPSCGRERIGRVMKKRVESHRNVVLRLLSLAADEARKGRAPMVLVYAIGIALRALCDSNWQRKSKC
jgi:hypothetical protein